MNRTWENRGFMSVYLFGYILLLALTYYSRLCWVRLDTDQGLPYDVKVDVLNDKEGSNGYQDVGIVQG